MLLSLENFLLIKRGLKAILSSKICEFNIWILNIVKQCWDFPMTGFPTVLFVNKLKRLTATLINLNKSHFGDIFQRFEVEEKVRKTEIKLENDPSTHAI